MNRPEHDKSRLERLLEAGVYAPVGFLVTRSKTMPDLATAGRKQIAFARSLGQAALKGFVRSINRDEPAPPATPPPAARVATPSPATAPPPSSPVASAEAVAVVTHEADLEPVDEADMSVAGYDDLTAKQVIELLKTCTTAQAQWIHDHETSHKERITVLRAAAKVLD